MQDTAAQSPFWFRRLSEISLLISLLLLVIFGIQEAINPRIEVGLNVPLVIIVFAIINVAVSAYALYRSRHENIFYWGIASYATLTVWAGALVFMTGGAYSPFISLWMLVAAFSGLFGLVGLVPLAIIVNSYIAWEFVLTPTRASVTRIALFVLATNLPLIVSYMIWRKKSSAETSKEGQVTILTKRLNEESYKSDIVINSIADGVIVIDGKGVIQLVNPAAEGLLGWAINDATGLHYESVIRLVNKHDKPIGGSGNPIEEVAVSKQPIVNNELSMLSKNNKKMIVSLVVSPVIEDGNVAARIVVFRDITAEKIHEREQAEFISTASHEMRTPVAAIEGYLGLISNTQTATIDARGRAYLEKAQESVKHLGQLFGDLLTVSRADDSRLESHPELIDVVKYTGDIAESLLPKAREKNLTLEFVPAQMAASDSSRVITPVFYANVDKGHLREVIANLIENAIKYTKQGVVRIDVTGNDRAVIVKIKDSGIGISREDMPHLFQKFYRVDNSDTREIGGTGLGLYICRRLAESMDGSLTVESEYGHGSTFALRLQRVDSQQLQSLQQAAQIAASQQERAAALQPSLSPVPAQAPPAPASPVTVASTQPQPAAAAAQAPQPAPQQPPATSPASNQPVQGQR